MRHSRLEVTLRPVDKSPVGENRALHTNTEIMQKFLNAAEAGEAKEHIKKKLAEGAQFDFDAEKLFNGTMTDADWQNIYSLQNQSWRSAALKNYGKN